VVGKNLHNHVLQYFYTSTSIPEIISLLIKCTGQVIHMEEIKKNLVRKF